MTGAILAPPTKPQKGGLVSWLFTAVLLVLVVLPHVVAAQNPKPPDIKPSETKTAAPQDKVRVQAFLLTGNRVIRSEKLAPVIKPYIGQALSLAELQQVADLLSQEYRRRGYTIATAYIPQQDIAGGVIEIAILEGTLGELTITGNRYYSTEFIRAGFAQVIEDKAIKQSSLERSLLLLNENMDLNMSAALQPGKTTGSTDIVATAKDKLPLHVSLDYNNFGIPSVSRNRFGAGLEAGNVLLEGSSLRLNGILGEEPDRLLFYLGSYSIPLNHQGTKLILGGSNGRFDVGGELASLGIRGKIKTYDISMTHPLIKTRLENLTAEFGFMSKDNRLFILGPVSGDDHVRAFKAGLNYDRTDSTGRNFASVYGFQGIGKNLGGMENDDPLATTSGADNRFTKGNLYLGRVQSLGNDMFLILRGSGQISTGPLVVIEQFLLGGPDSVRGYQLGQRLGDEGYTVSAEMRVPIPKVGEYAQLAFFVDHGAARVRNPGAGQNKTTYLTGIGPGIRVNLPYVVDSSIRVDVGFPMDPSKAAGGSLSGGSSPTVYIQAMVRY